MSDTDQFEQDLSETLEEWVLKSQGVIATKRNPVLFLKLLKSKGFEIVRLGDLQQLRNDQKVIKSELDQVYRLVMGVKAKFDSKQSDNIITVKPRQE